MAVLRPAWRGMWNWGGLAVAALGLGLAGPAAADPIPLPSSDFSLKANLPRGATMNLAYSSGHMRVEMARPDTPGTIVGLIDLKARRMVMMTPNLPKVAVEMALPPEYVVGAQTGTGSKVGHSQVAGEPCDLWQVDPPESRPDGSHLGPTVACITPDGIALRAQTELKGTSQVLYEVESLARGPQDPKLFLLPPGVKVMKIPQGRFGHMLGLPGGLPK